MQTPAPLPPSIAGLLAGDFPQAPYAVFQLAYMLPPAMNPTETFYSTKM